MNGLKYQTLYFTESLGFSGSFGLRIEVASSRPIDIQAEEIQLAAYNAAKLIEDEIRAANLALDPKTKTQADQEKASLIGLFPGRIFVESIPNGYMTSWSTRHLPWFVITTEIGRFKVGWRKRVIHLEWTETVVKKTAYELFPNEDVTKSGCMIHAWDLDKAREYVNAILVTQLSP